MFKYFSNKNKLKREYKKYMKLYFDYSKIDRKKSDEYFSKANEIMKEIDKIV